MKKHVPEIYLEQLYLNELSAKKSGSIDNEDLDNLLNSIKLSNRENSSLIYAPKEDLSTLTALTWSNNLPS